MPQTLDKAKTRCSGHPPLPQVEGPVKIYTMDTWRLLRRDTNLRIKKKSLILFCFDSYNFEQLCDNGPSRSTPSSAAYFTPPFTPFPSHVRSKALDWQGSPARPRSMGDRCVHGLTETFKSFFC